MKDQDKMYWITVEDIQRVAMDTLDCKLTAKELENIANRMGDYIDWYEAVDLAITDSGITENSEAPAMAKRPEKIVQTA